MYGDNPDISVETLLPYPSVGVDMETVNLHIQAVMFVH